MPACRPVRAYPMRKRVLILDSLRRTEHQLLSCRTTAPRLSDCARRRVDGSPPAPRTTAAAGGPWPAPLTPLRRGCSRSRSPPACCWRDARTATQSCLTRDRAPGWTTSCGCAFLAAAAGCPKPMRHCAAHRQWAPDPANLPPPSPALPWRPQYNYNPHAVFAGGVGKVSDNGKLQWPKHNMNGFCGDAVGENKWDAPGQVRRSPRAAAPCGGRGVARRPVQVVGAV